MKRILIVDDEPNVHYSFRRILPQDCEVISALDGEEAIRKVRNENPDLVIMDIRMPGMGGLHALTEIRETDPRLPVIIMTAYGSMQTAIEAMKSGAYEYVLKPFDIPEMQELVEKALTAGELMRRTVTYRPGEEEGDGEDVIVGSSPGMQEVFKLIGQVAEQDVTVLLRGESGTGKELVARAIYHHSLRAGRPFIAVNCAAIPDAILESELFGYEKGAFTDATQQRIGRFEQADRGTAFLDEIGDMSLSTQAKILRVLQEGEFTRLGGRELIEVDVRLIAATNMDLERAISEHRFRRDLYYRLNVVTITLPPLRERKGDLPELVEYFVRKFGRTRDKAPPAMGVQAMSKLQEHHWPGNVRELENCIKRALVLDRDDLIGPEDIRLVPEGEEVVPEDRDVEGLFREAVHRMFDMGRQDEVLATVERMLIVRALEETKGNQIRAARLLGINRNTLRSRMVRHGLK